MTKFIFGNKAKKAFKDCGDEEKLLIIKSKLEMGKCEKYCAHPKSKMGWTESKRYRINMGAIYRVLAPEPTPNSIDWDQCPAWAKYCFTDGLDYSWVANNPGHNDSYPICSVRIDEFPFFKRGTVAPKDSLLVRPEDK